MSFCIRPDDNFLVWFWLYLSLFVGGTKRIIRLTVTENQLTSNIESAAACCRDPT